MSKTYEPGQWDLTELFVSMDKDVIEPALAELEGQVAEFEKVRPSLNPDISLEDFLGLVGRLENISRLGQRLGGFAGLKFAEDTQNQTALSLVARERQFMAELENRTLFFELWWKDLDGANAARLISGSGDYRYFLEEIRRFKPYTLSEPEEKIINIKDITGVGSLITLYESITNRYVFELEVEGRLEKMTRGQLMVFARHHDPDLRAAAYQALYRVYGQDGPILGQMYQTVVRDWRNEQMNLRGHKNPMAVRNLGNDLPDEVVDLLLAKSRENAELFRRFFRIKARALGVERLRRYDVYAPISQAEKTYTYDQAVNMVMEAFGAFAPEVARLAGLVLEQSHVDSEVRPGKQDGAFCASVAPELTPWVLVNFQGKAGDVATLAHELGHAVHALLAADHSLFTYHASLPLAENASTFGEMLLLDLLLSRETDPAVRQDLLFRQLDDAYATICRQAYFCLFEKQAHEMTQEGATVDELAEVYMKNIEEQFGDAVEVTDEFKWEWVSIPHIYHTPFYVYAYAFGQLLVFSLYRAYQEDKESFVPGYLKILAAGGSQAPVEVLREAGLDITRPDFWQGGFDVVKEFLDRLEEDVPV